MHIHYKKLQMTCEGSLQVPLTHFTFSLVPDSSDGQVEMAQQIKHCQRHYGPKGLTTLTSCFGLVW